MHGIDPQKHRLEDLGSRRARQSGGYARKVSHVTFLFVRHHQQTQRVPVSHRQLAFNIPSYDGTVQLAI